MVSRSLLGRISTSLFASFMLAFSPIFWSNISPQQFPQIFPQHATSLCKSFSLLCDLKLCKSMRSFHGGFNSALGGNCCQTATFVARSILHLGENGIRMFVKGKNHPREYYALPFYKVEQRTTPCTTSNLSNGFPTLRFSWLSHFSSAGCQGLLPRDLSHLYSLLISLHMPQMFLVLTCRAWDCKTCSVYSLQSWGVTWQQCMMWWVPKILRALPFSTDQVVSSHSTWSDLMYSSVATSSFDHPCASRDHTCLCCTLLSKWFWVMRWLFSWFSHHGIKIRVWALLLSLCFSHLLVKVFYQESIIAITPVFSPDFFAYAPNVLVLACRA